MDGLLRYFPTAVGAMARVGFIAGVGVVAAREGTLDEKTRKGLSRLCKDWMLPLLLISSVPPSINLERLSRFWVLPVAAAAYALCGYLLGTACCSALDVEARHRSLVVAACALPTTTGPVLAVLAAVISAAPGLADRDAQLATGTAAVLVYTAFMSLIRWTLGWQLMAAPPSRALPLDSVADDSESAPLAMEAAAEPSDDSEGGPAGKDASAAPAPPPSVGCGAALRKAIVNRPVLCALLALVLARHLPSLCQLYSPRTIVRARACARVRRAQTRGRWRLLACF